MNFISCCVLYVGLAQNLIKMRVQKIKNCQECPFVNNDNEYGYDGCNLIYIDFDKWDQMPSDKIHKECPLKTDRLLVELE